MTNNRLSLTQRGRMLASLLGSAVLAAAVCWLSVEWGYNRIYIEQGESLLLRYKGPPLPFLPGGRPPATPGQFAEVDSEGNPLELGILEQMRGPGRHFYCPLWWETRRVPDQVVEPGEVAVVTSKMGKSLAPGIFLVDGDLGATQHKGILRKVFGPGRYRVNTYAYEFKTIELEKITTGNQTKHAGWVDIPTGYVGVVTNLTDNPITEETAGIQQSVLPPGLYPTNPNEQQIDIVEIGYREISIMPTSRPTRTNTWYSMKVANRSWPTMPAASPFLPTTPTRSTWILRPFGASCPPRPPRSSSGSATSMRWK